MSAIKTSVPTGTWVADKAHSRVEFAIRHMGIATVRGSFGEFAGTLAIGDGSARAFGTVDVASITTGEDARDTHLKSADFFDAEKFPQLQFESTGIEALDDEEFEIGLRSAAAPIRDHRGDVIAAVSIAGPVQRVDGKTLHRYGEEAMATGNAIPQRLGWRPPRGAAGAVAP